MTHSNVFFPSKFLKVACSKRRARTRVREEKKQRKTNSIRATNCSTKVFVFEVFNARAEDTVIRIFSFFFFFFSLILLSSVDSSRAKIKRKKGGTREEGKKKRVPPPPPLRDCVRRCEKKRVTRCSFSFVTLSSSSRDNRIEPAGGRRAKRTSNDGDANELALALG